MAEAMVSEFQKILRHLCVNVALLAIAESNFLTVRAYFCYVYKVMVLFSIDRWHHMQYRSHSCGLHVYQLPLVGVGP